MLEVEPTPGTDPTSGETLAATPSVTGPREPDADLERGTHVGRYVVLSKIGAGGMGIVFAAHDPDLDRKIALKLLKSRSDDRDSARVRLQREAQALAKLDHRNVVHVYDVGVHAEQLFVAMEFVEGQTLRTWMRASAKPRPWAEVVRVFAEAGRGLAAAHGVGLVHRDFKPDNVMLGDDGRVRVMDFGLARADPESELEARSTSQDRSETDKRALLETLTQTGALLGTPAYMAPELFEGLPADARTDQFAFCVALYEALYGQRPFAGANLAALLDTVRSGQIRAIPRGSKVPSWLHEAVMRGLATDRERRWPSMQQLLDVLVETPVKRRRMGWATAGVLAAFGGIATLTLLDEGDSSPIASCDEQSESVSAVWNSAVSDALAEAFAGQGELAQRSWPYLRVQLERWATNWAAVDLELCKRYGLGAAPELHERQLLCLDRQLDRFGLAIDLLGHATAKELERSFDVLEHLPDPGACRDVAAAPVNPNVDAQELGKLETAIDRAELEYDLGRLVRAEQASAELLTATKAPGFEELHVRVAVLRSRVLVELERRQEAIDAAFSGLAAAERDGAAALRLRAASNLVHIHVFTQELQDAKRWLTQAQTIAAEQELDRRLQRELAANEAWVAALDGRLDEAIAAFDRAIALTDPTTEAREHGRLTTSRAQMLAWLGKPEQALADFERGERELELLMGPEHPEMIGLRNAKVQIQLRLDQWQPARTELLKIAESTEALNGGPNSVSVMARGQAAWLLDRLGDCRGALAEYEPLLPLAREHMVYPSPELGIMLSQRAELCEYGTPEAVELAREVLALQREAVGDPHVMVADAHKQLARAHYAAGALEPAREEVEAALATFAAVAPIGAEFVPETEALAKEIEGGILRQ
jgi:serine/threonine protein kinase/tetratricopeptide (TPR) repeat protein